MPRTRLGATDRTRLGRVTVWRFGIGPLGIGTRDRARLEALLGAMFGIEVEVRPFLTYGELLDAVVVRAVHLAWLGPALYVRARERCEVEPLVRPERESGTFYRGALFVRSDSERKSTADLAGARIAWVDPSSCAGYLYPRLALTQSGLDPESLGTERFVGSYAAVVRAVESGMADVGAAYVELERNDDPSSRALRAAWTDTPLEARPILITDPVPADVVVATRALARDERDKVKRELVGMHWTEEGSAVLKDLFRAGALREVDGAEYETIVAALQAAGEKL